MEFLELLSEQILSSKETGNTTSPVKTLPTDQLLKYGASMSSYKSACQEDPDLKSFDSLLCERTSKLIRSVTGRGEKTGNLHLDSLKEICGFLAKVFQDMAKIIIDSKFDLSKNKELKSLVDLYFESTNKTLDFFNTVEKCVGKAKMIQLLIRVAIRQFETESMDTGKQKNKYAETLEELNKVIAMGDPFGEEFSKQYEDVYKEQVNVLDKIRELQVVSEKKHKKLKKWKRLGYIVFATVLISVFATALLASPVVAMAAKKLITPIITAGTCVVVMLKDYEEALKTQIDLFGSMENSTIVNTEEMKTLKSLVETLITRISLILKTVEVAVEKREEVAVKLVMQEIIQDVEEFGKQVDEVRAYLTECRKSVVSGRVGVQEHIANSTSLKGKW